LFSFKIKWRIAFHSEEELNELFEVKKAVVVSSSFGQVLWVKQDEEIHAFKNRCPHQNKPLNNCWLSENQIVCPFHRFHFSIENGRGHGTSLFKYDVKIEGGKVWLGKEIFSFF